MKTFRFSVNKFRQFWVVESPKLTALAVDSKMGKPLPTSECDASYSSAAVPSSLALVLAVNDCWDVAQIDPSIVILDRIDVINIMSGESSRHIEKSKPVHLMVFGVNRASQIAALCNRSNNVADLAASAGALDARENASVWAIMQKFFETCLRKHLEAFHHGGFITGKVSDRWVMNPLFSR